MFERSVAYERKEPAERPRRMRTTSRRDTFTPPPHWDLPPRRHAVMPRLDPEALRLKFNFHKVHAEDAGGAREFFKGPVWRTVKKWGVPATLAVAVGVLLALG